MRLLILIIILLCFKKNQAQEVFVSRVSDMPEAVSNNAVVEGWAKDTGYVYSFGGIDSTKLWSGIHLRSFRYNTISDVWDTIPSLPDTLGKIAAAASWVDSIVYIIGGYHVYSNSNEASSAKVHRFDPRTNTYLSDGMDIPIAIDDHVQAVWNDSLIYVITGWSNTGNVPNVQIYDPANDNWLSGTPTPNNNTYKAFGASGIIVGNTIYYRGGASNGFNFPGQSTLRIGQINSSNPTQITWSNQSTSYISYRAACIHSYVGIYDFVQWLGGSQITYNYNGIAYNGSGGVSPSNHNYEWGFISDTTSVYGEKLPMDIRGIAGPFFSHPIERNHFYLAGGMETNQKVSEKTLFIEVTTALSLPEYNSLKFKIFPNPTSSQINLLFDEVENKTIRLIDILGNVVLTKQDKSNNIQLDVSSYLKGIYFVKVTSEKGSSTQKIIIQ